MNRSDENIPGPTFQWDWMKQERLLNEIISYEYEKEEENADVDEEDIADMIF